MIRSRSSVKSAGALIALRLQIDLDQIGDGRLVLDDQDFLHWYLLLPAQPAKNSLYTVYTTDVSKLCHTAIVNDIRNFVYYK